MSTRGDDGRVRRAPTPDRPPPLTGELASWRSILRAARDWASLGQVAGGSGPVMVIPGYGCADLSTLLLRAHLSRLGWQTTGWGLGRNSGRLGTLVPAVVDRAAGLARGRSVRLIGWSLGGTIAREVARTRPALVHQVITLGSPVQGGPRHTALARRFGRTEAQLEALAQRANARESVPVPVPVDAVYAPADGVVDWRACLDPLLPADRHHALPTTHVGLVADPVALGTVAALLWAHDQGPPHLPGAGAPRRATTERREAALG